MGGTAGGDRRDGEGERCGGWKGGLGERGMAFELWGGGYLI